MRIGRLVLGAAALLLSGCGGGTGGNAAVGAHLYALYRCTACHVTNGVGTPIAVDLTQNITEVNYDLLRYYVVTHPPAAMIYTLQLHVTPQQIRDLNALAVSTLKPKQ